MGYNYHMNVVHLTSKSSQDSENRGLRDDPFDHFSRALFIIQNKIKNPKDLKLFSLDGYNYSKKDSSEYSPVFLRKN